LKSEYLAEYSTYGARSSIKWIGKTSRIIWSWTEEEKTTNKIFCFFWGRSHQQSRSHTIRQHCFVTTMARGSKIHPDVHYIVIRLSSIMKPGDIAIYTGISQQSVLHILRYFTLHGTVEHKKECKKKDSHLHDMDLEVSNSAFTISIRWLRTT
jgi:hypothetical protein